MRHAPRPGHLVPEAAPPGWLPPSGPRRRARRQ
jgi:hypothetical protein